VDRPITHVAFLPVAGISNPEDKVTVLMQLFFHEFSQSTVGQNILPKFWFGTEYSYIQLFCHEFLSEQLNRPNIV